MSEANEQVDEQPAASVGTEAQSNEAIPAWVDVPADMNAPQGARVCFMRFMGAWTMFPEKGERQCVMWELSDNDERVALVRCRDNPANASNELAKQMIRVVDGVKVNWAAKRGEPGNIDDFWREIGPKCRNTIVRHYQRTHVMSVEETVHFLEHCVAVRTAR